VAGWGTPIFQDDFTGTQLGRSWGVYNDPSGSPPRSTGAVAVRDGELTITGGFDASGKDVSGGVASDLNQMYGRWEVRFRIDSGAGYSPVLLLWPKNNADWPVAGEVDFVEIGAADRDPAQMFVHYGHDNSQLSGVLHADFTKWHTVAVEWLPGRLAFYLDGVRQSFAVTNAQAIPHLEPMHLALQLDQGCDQFVPCRNAQTPAKVVMQIDWVKIYSSN